MGVSSSISRFADYYRRNGLPATFRRALLAIRRTIGANRMIVFYCDLEKHAWSPLHLPRTLNVGRLTDYAELNRQDLEKMVSFWHPEQAHRNIKERFNRGASLWLIRSDETLAAYSWTIRGETIADYYFPMASDDVQLFDFYVFPEFRGRAILWFLITHILNTLKEEGANRVFGDVAEWNRASLSFYKTLPFRRLGLARKFKVLGRPIVWWEAKNACRTNSTAREVTGGVQNSHQNLLIRGRE